MKYFLFVFLILFLLSCSPIQNDWYEIEGTPDLSSYTEEEIYQFTIINIEYEKYSYGCQPAQNTWDIKKGNCCNYAIVALALIYKYKGKKLDLYEVSLKNTYYPDHATISCDSNYKKLWKVIKFDDVGSYISLHGGKL